MGQRIRVRNPVNNEERQLTRAQFKLSDLPGGDQSATALPRLRIATAGLFGSQTSEGHNNAEASNARHQSSGTECGLEGSLILASRVSDEGGVGGVSGFPRGTAYKLRRSPPDVPERPKLVSCRSFEVTCTVGGPHVLNKGWMLCRRQALARLRGWERSPSSDQEG
ncbi:hypothetical protein CSUI_004341 [Cystoisospora suis]|uniref:Uncharacterized protein n=1 Tax=Cystoisospora suis TaxID=483139 RepID=A0A2C6L1W6_9APIC|nr:hypothetical protein CSUI_004341 [Cystoisospora suis]